MSELLPSVAAQAALWMSAPLLLLTAVMELRYMRISNVVVAALAAVLLLTVPLGLSLGEAGTRIIFALLVFAIGFTGHSLGLFGAGDVKLLVVMILFVPSPMLTVFAVLLLVSLGIGLTIVQILRAVAASPDSTWAFLRDTRRFPVGAPIACTGLTLPLFQIALT